MVSLSWKCFLWCNIEFITCKVGKTADNKVLGVIWMSWVGFLHYVVNFNFTLNVPDFECLFSQKCRCYSEIRTVAYSFSSSGQYFLAVCKLPVLVNFKWHAVFKRLLPVANF